jgi:hypothetical protein
MKLGGLKLGNIPQKIEKKKLFIKKLDIFHTVGPFSRVQFMLYNILHNSVEI